ncbi:MAG: cellulose synthase subunit BcsC-related outer membrane protein [Hyphomonas sp.]
MKQPARILCTAALIAGFALWSATDPAAAETEGVFPIGIPRAAEPAARAETIPEPAPALVQTVWDLGASGDWEAAQTVLRALQTSHPAWQPPAGLKSHLAAGRRDQSIRDALAASDWAGALAQLPAPPPAACEESFHLWARADALEGLGAPAEISAFYVRSLTTCTNADLVAALADRSHRALDAAGLAAVAALPSLSQSRDTRVRLAHARLVRAHQWQGFEAAVAGGNLAAARALADMSDDPRLLAQAGWTFLAADAARAADYFEQAHALGGDADALRGLVLATLAAGKLAPARAALAQASDPGLSAELGARIDLAEAAVRCDAGDWTGAITLASGAARRHPGLAEPAQALIAGARLEAARAAYEAGDFAEARRLAREAADHAPLRRAALMRAAWSDLQLGRSADAAGAFSRLYLETPDSESAEGYALAAQRTGDLGTAAALARTLGGPLGAKVQARYAAAAFDQGDYLIARAQAPDTYAALDGLDGTWYRQSVSARRQGGTPGESRLTGLVSTTSAGTTRGPDRFEAGVSLYTLDAGGSAPRETFAAPYAAWSREGDTRLAARIGLLPLGSEADPALTAEIAAASDIRGGAVEARAFIRPRTESLLAMAGQSDTAGNVHGRVTETGARIAARLPVGKVHSLQAELSGARIGGERTADNSMIGAGISASRAFQRDGFAYLVTGPFYQFQAYDANTNFFAPGHGGYFSPQAFHRAGWSVNAQTDPLKTWIAKANLALAHETVEEEPAPANPLLAGPQPLIGGGDSSGLAGALDLALARRLSRNVIFSANLSAIASQAYEDVRFGFALTWVPGGRTGLVRADLPADPFNPGAWIQP